MSATRGRVGNIDRDVPWVVVRVPVMPQHVLAGIPLVRLLLLAWWSALRELTLPSRHLDLPLGTERGSYSSSPTPEEDPHP